MKVEKLPVVSSRLRYVPKGFGWVDHRLVKNGFVRECSSDGLALYLILITVCDRDGLSYYGEALLCALLGWSRGRLGKARKNLIEVDIVGYEDPIYQVLELPERGVNTHD